MAEELRMSKDIFRAHTKALVKAGYFTAKGRKGSTTVYKDTGKGEAESKAYNEFIEARKAGEVSGSVSDFLEGKIITNPSKTGVTSPSGSGSATPSGLESGPIVDQSHKETNKKPVEDTSYQETKDLDSEKDISSISPPPDAKGSAPAKDFFRSGSKGKPKASRTLMVAASNEWRKLKLEKLGKYGTQVEIDAFESEFGTWDTFLERFLAEVSSC